MLTFSRLTSATASLLLLSGTVASARPPVEPRAHSVGSRQLQSHSVTARKLAPGAVTRGALSPDILSALDAGGTPGPQGPMGPAGEPGAQGPAGPGAVAIRYSAQASDTPTTQQALDFLGFKVSTSCQKSGTQVQMGLSILSTEAAVIHDHFNVDFGTDPHTPGATQSGTLLFELQPGVEVLSSPPAVDAPNYGRVFVTLIYVAADRVVNVNAVLLIDAANETCQFVGVATPAAG